MKSIWDIALASIESRISPHYFEMWFKPIQCVSIEDSRILLRAPTAYIKEWFEDNYLSTVIAEIEAQTDRRYEILIEVDTPAPVRPAVYYPPTLPVGLTARDRSDDPSDAARREGPAKYTFDDFIVGPSNALAHAAARAIADGPGLKYNPLFIHGGTGLGKTHLMHAIGNEIKKKNPKWNILYTPAESFMNEYTAAIRNNHIDSLRRKYREQCDVLLVDDVQFLSGKEGTQVEFFHTFNSLFESHRQIVLSADIAPHEIRDLEERVRSRFQWGLIADIKVPELETRVAILLQKAEHQALDLPREVAQDLASHVRSNVRELQGLVNRLALLSALHGRPITLEFAREALATVGADSQNKLSIEIVQREVSLYYNIKQGDLKSARRHQSVVRPRQIAMYLARKLIRLSFPEIGARFGDKDHTTVMAACKKVEKLVHEDSKTRHEVEEIERNLTESG